jgi:hypothetical protein
MGIYIRLNVNPTGITQEDWESVYNESLVLLAKFPVPLMCLRIDKRSDGERRMSWASRLLEDEGTKDECWRVDGDSESNLRGETHLFYRNVDRQFGRGRPVLAPDKDVLWHVETKYGIETNGKDVFGAKTQGRPLHIAMLAVGLMVETRFPGKAAILGDCDQEQVDAALDWANPFLKSPAVPPVCLDPDRLYGRLKALHSDPEVVRLAFKLIFQGPAEDENAYLARREGAKEVLADLEKSLLGYESLNLIGVIDIIGEVLRLTDDPAKVIAFVEEANRKRPAAKQFPLEDLFRVCYQFFTGSSAEGMPGSRGPGVMPTIDDQLSDILLKVFGTERSTYRMAPERMLDAFRAHASGQKRAFEEIAQEIDETRPKAVSRGKRATEASPPSDKPTDSNPGVDYILRQVERQRYRFPDDEDFAVKFGRDLYENLTSKVNFPPTDPQHYIRALCEVSMNAPRPLREATWKRIDAETDIKILQQLLALASISNPELNFSQWREHVLETPRLWPMLARGMLKKG